MVTEINITRNKIRKKVKKSLYYFIKYRLFIYFKAKLFFYKVTKFNKNNKTHIEIIIKIAL